MRICVLLLFSFIVVKADGQVQLNITLKHGTTNELAAKQQLERLLHTYNFKKWLFTKAILIDDAQFIPHSHPVLTLNSRYINSDLQQLSTLLHEEFHWARFSDTALSNAIAAYRETYPNAPASPGSGGAQDLYSTYLHLVICDLEFAAMTSLFGMAEAKSIMRGWYHYTWVYDKVINTTMVRQINEQHKLTIKELKEE